MKLTISWLVHNFKTLLDSVTSILNDHKSLLSWIYSIAYLCMAVWCVAKDPSTRTTVIAVTGGVVSTIFASYVAGSSYVQVNTPEPPDPEKEKAEAGD